MAVTSPRPPLDLAGAAAYLGITPRHLRELQYRGELAYVKVGRLVRFRPADLDRYLDERTVEAT